MMSSPDERSQVDLAWKQIDFARGYTHSLLDGLDESRWYEMPAGCPSHVAWQVGHLAMAEYGLCLFRRRGRRQEDAALMSSAFRKRFSRGSSPSDDGPSPAEIREVLAAVHAQVEKELASCSDAELADPIDEPYAVFANRLGGLLFCSAHEMLHAGQIGLIRRLLGIAPVR